MIPATATHAPSKGIRHLADLVGAACLAPMNEMPERLAASFAGVAGDAELVPVAARKTAAGGYARHVLYNDPRGRFTIVSLVWGAGQFSPVHGHHTWCAYAVCEGELSETGFAYDAVSRLARPLGCVGLEAGAINFAYAGLDQIHKLGNGCDNTARSIHIYGVDAERIATHVNRVVGVTPQARR